MSDPKKPQTLSEDELDVAKGAGTSPGGAAIDFVEVSGDDTDGSATRAGSHRTITPVRMTKRID